jgi:hypothetical protein
VEDKLEKLRGRVEKGDEKEGGGAELLQEKRREGEGRERESWMMTQEGKRRGGNFKRKQREKTRLWMRKNVEAK